jgi:hypothetical protein
MLKDKEEKCNLYKKLQRWVAKCRGMGGLDCREMGSLGCRGMAVKKLYEDKWQSCMGMGDWVSKVVGL